MALSNYIELQASIADFLTRGDLTAAIVDFIRLTEAMLDSGDEARNIEPLRHRLMETTSADNTPTSGDITLASDFLEMISVRYTATDPTELDYASPKWLHDAYPTTESGTPRYYTIVGSTLKIRPTGTSDIDYDYYKKIPALASNSTNWLLTLAPQVYLNGAIFWASIYGGTSPEAGMASLALFRSAIDGLGVTDRRRAGSFTIRAAGVVP
jgi:hypothetical protein